MKLHRFSMFVLSLVFSLFAISHGIAAESPLSLAPGDSEFVAFINLRQIADSPLSQKILQEKGGEKADAGIKVVKGLTGVDLLKDLDQAAFWGRIDDNDSIVFLVRGRFNQETLINLLKVNPKYQATQRSGLTMHEWFDEKENRMKYGAFLQDDTAIICNQPQGLDAVVKARSGDSNSFIRSSKAKHLPQNWDSLSGCIMIFKPERTLPDGKLKDTLQAESFLGTLVIKPESVTVSLILKTATPDAGQQWLDMAKGLIALGQLQKENANFRILAQGTQFSLSPDRKGITLDIRLTDKDVLELMKEPTSSSSPSPLKENPVKGK